MSDYKAEVTREEFEELKRSLNNLKLQFEEEQRSNQVERNVLTRRIVQLHEKLLGEAPAKMRRVS